MVHKQDTCSTTHFETIVEQVHQEVANALQINPLRLDVETSLVELGSDSLLLMQVAKAIKGTYGVKVGIRQLFEGLDTVNKLATHIHQSLPSEWFKAHSGTRTEPAVQGGEGRFRGVLLFPFGNKSWFQGHNITLRLVLKGA